MKLFLSSISISKEQLGHFLSLVGKEASDITFALIENAADPYPESAQAFVYETRTVLSSYGMKVKLVNLAQFKGESEKLYEMLKTYDVIWFGGGNTFYLRWLMKESGFDKIVTKLLNAGIVYGGGSAGEILAGPSLKYIDLVDDPKASPEGIYIGLNLTNLTILPHWGDKDFQEKLVEIKSLYKKDGVDVVTISDEQAVVINGENWKIIP